MDFTTGLIIGTIVGTMAGVFGVTYQTWFKTRYDKAFMRCLPDNEGIKNLYCYSCKYDKDCPYDGHPYKHVLTG